MYVLRLCMYFVKEICVGECQRKVNINKSGFLKKGRLIKIQIKIENTGSSGFKTQHDANVCKSMLKYAYIFNNIQQNKWSNKYAQVCKNMLLNFQVHLIMVKCTIVHQNTEKI